MITGTQISSRVGTLLHDSLSVLWTETERLLWINDGRREMAVLKPTVFGDGTEVTHTLTAGCKQRIATAGAYRIDSVNYNVTSGKAIRATTKEQLDAFRPAWRSDTGTYVQNWFSDETDPLAFWVYPAVDGEDIVAHVHITPTDLGSLSDVALPFDVYEPALVNYVCFRALSKNAADVGNVTMAEAYYKLFLGALKG